jgi:DNA-binding NarL/FixJ family response regulator
MLTMHNERALIGAALNAGVLGHVLKHRLSLDLVPAVDAALRGKIFVTNLARSKTTPEGKSRPDYLPRPGGPRLFR